MSNVPPRTTRIVGPSGPRDISVLTEIFQRGFRHESESEFHFRPPSATSTEKEEAHGRSRAEWSWVTHDCSSVGLPGPTNGTSRRQTTFVNRDQVGVHGERG